MNTDHNNQNVDRDDENATTDTQNTDFRPEGAEDVNDVGVPEEYEEGDDAAQTFDPGEPAQDEKELSYGEKIVRSAFNPSGVGNVNFFKETTAKILNVIDENRDLDPRLAAIAATKFEEACMWAVKLATT